jgi:arylsulfate sulfotransferase
MARQRCVVAAIAALLSTGLLAGCGGASRSAAATQLSADASGPSVAAIAPNLAIEGGPGFTLTVRGSGFTSQSVVAVGGQTLPTQLQGNGSLQATVPAGAIARRGQLAVTVTGASPSATLYVVPSGVVSPTNNPLVADYAFGAPIGAHVSVEFGPSAGDYPWPTLAQAIPAGGGRLNLLVAGMQANTEYHMRAVIALPDGDTVYDLDHTFATGAIPAGIVPALAPSPASGSPAGGVVTVDLIPLASPVAPVVAADTLGNPVWYYADPNFAGSIQGMKRLANGDLVFDETNQLDSSLVREIDLAGDALRQLTLTQLNADLQSEGAGFQVAFLSHDILPLPTGHIVLIGDIYKTYTNLTCCAGQSVKVEGSVLIDLNRDWVPDWTWNPFDHLDVNRIQMAGVFPDWIHGNAILYTADHDLLFSMRHQSWIVKIDYADGGGTGAVLWKLGYQGDFTLTPNDPSQWFYGQHKPTILADNGHQMTLAVWDDGNSRVMNSSGEICGAPGAPACYSRAVVYQINQDARTAQEIFQYTPGPFCFWGGNAGQLMNGDIEFDITTGLPEGSEVMEVTDAATPRVVWSMTIDNVPNDQTYAYRAHRIGSLYKGISWNPAP